MGDIAREANQAVSRFPLHTFTFPDEVRELPSDPKTIVLRQLTFGEEQQALEAATANKTSFVLEGAMRSVLKADNKDITWESNGKEIFFSGLSNKVRDLVVRAFSKVSLPDPKVIDDFFASEKTTPA